MPDQPTDAGNTPAPATGYTALVRELRGWATNDLIVPSAARAALCAAASCIETLVLERASVVEASAAWQAESETRADQLAAEVEHWRVNAAAVGVTDGHALRLDMERLTGERDAAVEALTEARLLSAGPAPEGGFTMRLSAGIIPLMASAMANDFKERGGENYVEYHFNESNIGPFTLTMQRMCGKTPHQLQKQAESERDQLKADVLSLSHPVCQQLLKDKAHWHAVAEGERKVAAALMLERDRQDEQLRMCSRAIGLLNKDKDALRLVECRNVGAGERMCPCTGPKAAE
jgi:hypothetical protein